MKKIFTICFLLIAARNSFAQQITFQKTYGGINIDYGESVHQTADGGYIIAGHTNSFGAGNADVCLIKTATTGDTVWTKTFGGTSDDEGWPVQQTTDGGYIIGGTTYGFGAGNADVYLIKTDAIGDSLWTKTFGGTNYDVCYSVQQSTDGGYIIAGGTNSFGAGFGDVYLIKTDATGDTMWTKTFGGIGNDLGWSLQQTTDGGYIITGQTSSFGAGGLDIYLIRTNPNGDTLWTKTFGGIGDDVSYSVQQTTDGGYIITGRSSSFGAGNADVYLIKTDATGDTLWTKTFGGTGFDFGYSGQQINDGGYIIIGSSISFGAGNADVYLIKTDATGDTMWTKTFGGIAHEEGYSVQQTTDGGYIIVGFTMSLGAGNHDIYLIKTDSMGNSGCNQGSPATIVTSPATIVTSPVTVISSGGIVTSPATIVGSGGTVTTLCTTVGINEILNHEELVLFPNPFSDKINITTERNEPVEITLFDITSRKIFNQSFTNSTSINTSHLSKGIYIYEVRNKNGVIKKGKVVKN